MYNVVSDRGAQKQIEREKGIRESAIDNYTDAEEESYLHDRLVGDGPIDDIIDVVISSYEKVFSCNNAPEFPLKREDVFFNLQRNISNTEWAIWIERIVLATKGLVRVQDVNSPSGFGTLLYYDKKGKIILARHFFDGIVGAVFDSPTAYQIMYWMDSELNNNGAPRIVFVVGKNVYSLDEAYKKFGGTTTEGYYTLNCL